MYLSKLEVHGFKSFALKTLLRFDSGITAIVGPNGCGKTNVADAIRWVLGEQKASALRSDKMENVIFNGTKDRKPLGMSEVSITIENTKNILPTEFSEVTLTRRLYRSGESEYLLNKVPCRLKDIINLFMDTGMGPDAYSVIELKMIEDILSERYDDRRRLFEEAAGVTKYKSRRRQALRKLEQTKSDLIRIQDIISEVEKNVGSLSRQAKKTEQFEKIKSELRDLEISTAEREVSIIYSKLDPVKTQLETVKTELAHVTSSLGQKEAEDEKANIELLSLEKKLADMQREWQVLSNQIHKLEEEKNLKKQRISGLSDNIVRFKNEIDWVTGQLEQLEREALSTKEHFLAAETNRLNKETAYRQQQEQSKTIENEYRQFRQQLVEKDKVVTNKREERNRILAETTRLQDRIEMIQNRDVTLRQTLESGRSELEKLKQTELELSEKFETAKSSYLQQETDVAAKQEMKKNLQEALLKKQDELLLIELEKSKVEQTLSLLRKMSETFEGMPESSRFVLTTFKSKGVLPLFDQVKIKNKSMESGISVYLADRLYGLVTDSTHQALDMIEEVSKAENGVVNLYVHSSSTNGFQLPDIDNPSVRPAIHELDFPPAIQSIMHYLFKNVYFTETDDVAMTVFKNHHDVVIISGSGKVFMEGTLIKGGRHSKSDISRIGIEDRIQSNESTLKELEISLSQLQSNILVDKEKISAIDADVSGLPMEDSRQRVNQLERELTVTRHTIQSTQQTISQIENDLQATDTVIQTTQTEIETKKQLLAQLDTQLKVIEDELNGLKSQVETKEGQWRQLGQLLEESRAAWVEAQGQVTNLENEKRRIEQRLSELMLQRDERKHQIESAEMEITTLTHQIDESETHLVSLYKNKETFRDQLETAELEVSKKRGAINLLDSEIKDLRRQKDTALALDNQLTMRQFELESKISQLKERILEEYEIELQRIEVNEEQEMELARLNEEVRRQRERLRMLGSVNPLALEEYTREKERLDFLTTQKKDLDEAEHTLMDTIEEINHTAQQQFLVVFEHIRTNFNKTFMTLFDPGDEADLILEKEVDPLEAKIDIIAKPRGKRPQSITLLSGGEKTLTAIALLFAIYLVKPSPFCILDEVDAPLDDANIGRFSKILQEFSGETQFIIITHNKKTMEIANTLYGVTMEEKGVSKIVSVKFDQVPAAS